jgi:hypothetical protein
MWLWDGIQNNFLLCAWHLLYVSFVWNFIEFCFGTVITIGGEIIKGSPIVIGYLTFILTFKWPVFTYVNAHKNTPRDSFYVFRQWENLCIFRAYYIIPILFSTKCHLCHNFIFHCVTNTFFIKHTVTFKYQPGHLKTEEKPGT